MEAPQGTDSEGERAAVYLFAKGALGAHLLPFSLTRYMLYHLPKE